MSSASFEGVYVQGDCGGAVVSMSHPRQVTEVTPGHRYLKKTDAKSVTATQSQRPHRADATSSAETESDGVTGGMSARLKTSASDSCWMRKDRR